MKRIINISYILVISSFLLMHISGLQYAKYLRDLILSINLILLMAFFQFREKKKIKSKVVVKIVILSMILLFCIYPIIFINELYKKEIIEYCIETLLVLLNIFNISKYMCFSRKKIEFFKCTYLMISAFLIIMYAINFDNFEVLNHISDVFSNSGRYRQSFGLNHANTVGQLCFCSQILYYYFKVDIKYLKFYRLTNMIILIILISTASRTAITSLLIFYILYFYFVYKYKTRNVYRIFICLISLVILIMLNSSLLHTDMNSILVQTNRTLNFKVNIPILYENSKELFGLGYFSPGLILAKDFGYSMVNIDNWYLYIFMSLGKVGFIITLVILIYLIANLILNKENNIYLRNMGRIVILVYLYYSFFESIFFLVDSSVSIIMWLIFMIHLHKDEYNQNSILSDR